MFLLFCMLLIAEDLALLCLKLVCIVLIVTWQRVWDAESVVFAKILQMVAVDIEMNLHPRKLITYHGNPKPSFLGIMTHILKA